MSRFPKIISEDKPGKISHHSDIGIDILMEGLNKCIREPEISNAKISRDSVIQRINKWVLGFETNPKVIAARQDVIKYALQHPTLLRVIDHLAVYPDQSTERDDNFSKHTGMMKRFETFAQSVIDLKAVLVNGKRPDTLTELLRACEEVEKRIKDAQTQLNPELELRVEVEGRFGRGVLLNIVAPERKENCSFVYVLTNKYNNSVQRGQHKSNFGLFSSRKDFFLEGLDKYIEDTLVRTIKKKPFFKRVYTVDGILKYSLSGAKAEGELHFARDGSKEEGTFFISFPRDHHDTPRSIIELVRFAHNYQIINPFEGVISDFEDMMVELKALSAITRFFENLHIKGFPLSFPNIIQDDSDTDLFIKDMYHPLLAYFSEIARVVPNTVETTVGQNVRLITGANNNGKTSYINGLGLSQTLCQAGIPIVAEEARMRVKDKILIHYVHPADIKSNQSRFAHECDRVLKLFEEISSDSIILCDELFTGTAPQDGEVVSELVLRALIRTGATVFFVSHYHELGDIFRDSPYVAQLCCKLDHSQNPSAYTYEIKPGISRDSDGLIVASEYGVSKKNLENLLEQKAKQGDFKLR
jgi:DNA mismatch repair ATPase MutS